MNILFYQHQYPSFGGIETVTTLLARQFVKDGHRVKIVSFRHRDGTGLLEQLPDGATWQELPEERFDSAANMTALSAIFNDFVPDVVIFQDSYTNIHALLFEVVGKYRATGASVKVIVVEHTMPLGTFKGRREVNDAFTRLKLMVIRFLWPLYFYRRFRIERQRRVEIAASVDWYVTFCPQYVRRLKWILPRKWHSKLAAIANPVERANVVCKERAREALFVGTLSLTKGVDRVLNVWKMIQSECPDWRLVIVGDGNQRRKLENLAVALRLRNVSFEGYRADVGNYFNRASLFLSASDYEGWPMTLCEAMSHGCVPVAFDSFGAVREIVDVHSGCVVPAFDLIQYAKCIMSIANDDEARGRMSRNAQKIAYRFSCEKIAKQWYELMV